MKFSVKSPAVRYLLIAVIVLFALMNFTTPSPEKAASHAVHESPTHRSLRNTRPALPTVVDREALEARPAVVKNQSRQTDQARPAVVNNEARRAGLRTPASASRSQDKDPAVLLGESSGHDMTTAHLAQATPAAGNGEQTASMETGVTGKHYALPLIYRLDDKELVSHIPQMTPEVIDFLKSKFESDIGLGEIVSDPASGISSDVYPEIASDVEPGIAPDQPAYIARWEQAEMSLQDRIRILYGWAALGEYERQSAIAADQPAE